MKNKPIIRTALQHGAKRINTGLVIAAAIFLHHNAMAVPLTVGIGTAGNFAILAGSQITDAGGASTIVTGDVGLSPATGASIGLLAGQVVGGTIYSVDAFGPGGSVENAGLLTSAKNDLTTGYNDAAGRSADVAFGVVDNQLGGLTLFPGVYSFGHADTANLIGNLTLDANGEVDPVWIFQASSDLVTASYSTVTMIGAGYCDVFWLVGSSATIGSYTDFVGYIMADQSIALQTGATLYGSALARIAAVTLDHNTITSSFCCDGSDGGNGGTTSMPDDGSTIILLGSGLASLVAFRRRFLSVA